MTPEAEVGADCSGEPRPRWVRWQGERRPVLTVEHCADEPERLLYRVLLTGGVRLLLVYRRSDARWSVTPVSPPFGSLTA